MSGWTRHPKPTRLFVRCKPCDIVGPWRLTEAEAATAWNARPQRDRLRSACKDALEFFEETGRSDMAVAVMLRETLEEASI